MCSYHATFCSSTFEIGSIQLIKPLPATQRDEKVRDNIDKYPGGGAGEEWGVNTSEDARHWIGLLQNNPSTGSHYDC